MVINAASTEVIRIDGVIMKAKSGKLVAVILYVWICYPGAGWACDPIEDGCLGCSDTELPRCIDQFVAEVCNAGGGFEICDRNDAAEDIERLVLRSTGMHMSKVRALVRGAKRYQHPGPPRP